MPELLAIVILNYNGEKFLQKFLPSVIRYSKGHRIVVADNCSTDQSVPLLRKHFPMVEVLEMPENFGFAGGYNKALQEVCTEYYILLNSDVEVSANWIPPMLQLLEGNPKIAACQPKIRAYEQPKYFEYAGAGGGEVDLLGYPFCRGRIVDTLEEDIGQYNTSIPIFWATGACMMIRSSIFHDLGGFDARFFAHMEEIDLCWRIHHRGYQVYCCHESTIFHLGGGTLPKKNPRKTFLNFRNGLWMLYKNSSSKELIWKLPCRMLLDLVGALLFFIKGQVQDTKAVFKAHRTFLSSMPEFSKDRKRLKSKKIKHAPLYKGIIAWDYYVKKKKTYNNLNADKKKS